MPWVDTTKDENHPPPFPFEGEGYGEEGNFHIKAKK